MYVCICNAVTDCQIREAYGNGACDMRGLRRELGVASCCGRCAKCARGVLKECRAECECSSPAILDEPAPLLAAVGG